MAQRQRALHPVVPECPLIEMPAFNHAFQDTKITTRAEDTEFAVWADRWMTMAKHTGPSIDNIAGRVERLVQLWKELVTTGQCLLASYIVDQGSCEDERVGELFPVSLHNIPPEYAPR
jgi:hypothetical protein